MTGKSESTSLGFVPGLSTARPCSTSQSTADSSRWPRLLGSRSRESLRKRLNNAQPVSLSRPFIRGVVAPVAFRGRSTSSRCSTLRCGSIRSTIGRSAARSNGPPPPLPHSDRSVPADSGLRGSRTAEKHPPLVVGFETRSSSAARTAARNGQRQTGGTAQRRPSASRKWLPSLPLFHTRTPVAVVLQAVLHLAGACPVVSYAEVPSPWRHRTRGFDEGSLFRAQVRRALAHGLRRPGVNRRRIHRQIGLL